MGLPIDAPVKSEIRVVVKMLTPKGPEPVTIDQQRKAFIIIKKNKNNNAFVTFHLHKIAKSQPCSVHQEINLEYGNLSLSYEILNTLN